MNPIIEVKGLVKTYGSIRAVDHLDFYVEPGKLFAFLGPNGAGKSTTINVLCTLLKPDEGEVRIASHRLGEDDEAIRRSIGIVFQESVLDPLLTVQENLWTRGSFYGKQKSELAQAVQAAMKAVEVQDLAHRRYGTLSGGQRRRVDIARALLHQPQVLFLDEPTTGLDPQTRKNVWETIQQLQLQHGMTVFLTTHYMEEAANADYVIVLDEGKIAARGTPLELKEQYSNDSLQFKPRNLEEARTTLLNRGVVWKEVSDLVIVALESTLDAFPLLQALQDNIVGFQVLNGTMDDAFVGITGKEMRP